MGVGAAIGGGGRLRLMLVADGRVMAAGSTDRDATRVRGAIGVIVPQMGEDSKYAACRA
jgi:hypothetical protein